MMPGLQFRSTQTTHAIRGEQGTADQQSALTFDPAFARPLNLCRHNDLCPTPTRPHQARLGLY